jgi:hypothetical protein
MDKDSNHLLRKSIISANVSTVDMIRRDSNVKQVIRSTRAEVDVPILRGGPRLVQLYSTRRSNVDAHSVNRHSPSLSFPPWKIVSHWPPRSKS